MYTQYPLKELEFLGAPSLTGREVIPGFCWTSVELFPKTPLHGFSMLAGLPYNMAVKVVSPSVSSPPKSPASLCHILFIIAVTESSPISRRGETESISGWGWWGQDSGRACRTEILLWSFAACHILVQRSHWGVWVKGAGSQCGSPSRVRDTVQKRLPTAPEVSLS